MSEILMVLGLVLGLSVLQRIVLDLVAIRIPAALTRVVPVLFGIGLAYGLDYSVFAAFGQDLRAEWMHPVMTGVVLVAFGEFVRTLVNAVAHRAGEPPVDTTATAPVIRAA